MSSDDDDDDIEDDIDEAIRADDLRRLKQLVMKHPGALEAGSYHMHEAVESGASLEVVRFIAKNIPNDAFDRRSCDMNNGTPFHSATKETGLDVLRYLDEEYPGMIEMVNEDGNRIIEVAILSGLQHQVEGVDLFDDLGGR